MSQKQTFIHNGWSELAHLLVCINKTFGTKIFITSHNPDMVSAIRYISEKAGVLNTTRFIWQNSVKVLTCLTTKIWTVILSRYLSLSTNLLILFRNT